VNDDRNESDDLLSLPPAEFGAEVRRRALAAYEEGDWYGVYGWTKAWVTNGGGAWSIDAWLLYVVSALLHGQPRTPVHSVDIALRTWIEAPGDRAVLRWVRGAVVHRRLKDPKTAQADYAAATEAAPTWLQERIEGDLVSCAADAALSRKRKPSVTAAPEFASLKDQDFVTGPTEAREPGEVPTVWDQVLAMLGDRQ
jgi:hypothetical protein